MPNKVKHWTGITLCVLTALALAACPRPPEVEVEITPPSSTVHVGDVFQFEASSTSEQDEINWSSGDPSVAVVDGDGLVTGESPGETAIVAEGSPSGATAEAVLTVLPEIEADVRDYFDGAKSHLETVPGDVLDEERRHMMEGLLDEARRTFAVEGPCPAAALLELYALEAADVRSEQAAEADWNLEPGASLGHAEMLQARGLQLQHRVLAARPGEPCDEFPGVERPSETTAAEANLEGVEGAVHLGRPQFWPVIVENEAGEEEVFTEFQFPDVEAQGGEPGAPGIPAVRELVAVPPGASVQAAAAPRTAMEVELNLYPIQEQPWDQAPSFDLEEEPPLEFFGDRPFTRNRELHETDAFLPSDVIEVTPMGRYRDMDLIQVEMHGAQYNPVSGALRVFDEIQYEIEFSGGEEGFTTQSAFTNFERLDLYVGSLLNWEAVLETPPILFEPGIIGAEYLIVTHPDFANAAHDLADWKREKGVTTAVFQGGLDSGVEGRETNEEVNTFIEDFYESSLIRPSYVLLLGDSDFIEPFERDGIYSGDNPIGTDWPYAVLSGDGGTEPLVPSLAVGRMPVRTAQQAQAVVDKVILYESSPPPAMTNASFYQNMTMAAQFQCCRTGAAQPGTAQRTFAEVAEFVRDAMLDEGYDAERIYLRTIDGAYQDDPTPRYYYDGAPLPSSIGPDSGFAWDGTRQDVIDAFNDGRFLILHRDHGWRHGWGSPPLHTNNVVNDLENGPLLPVVFSINCTTGLFDNEFIVGGGGSTPTGEYFAEALLRKEDGGAVGVIGATRLSPSWPNSVFTRGLFDAIWPDTLPGFGSGESHRRIGDVLNHGKLYTATEYSGGILETMNYLYHVLGDPTLEIWTGPPFSLSIPQFEELVLDRDRLSFLYDDAPSGTEVTVYQLIEDEVIPIGRGRVDQEGIVNVPYETTPDPGFDLQVGVSARDAVSASAVIEIDALEPR